MQLLSDLEIAQVSGGQLPTIEAACTSMLGFGSSSALAGAIFGGTYAWFTREAQKQILSDRSIQIVSTFPRDLLFAMVVPGVIGTAVGYGVAWYNASSED